MVVPKYHEKSLKNVPWNIFLYFYKSVEAILKELSVAASIFWKKIKRKWKTCLFNVVISSNDDL